MDAAIRALNQAVEVANACGAAARQLEWLEHVERVMRARAVNPGGWA